MIETSSVPSRKSSGIFGKCPKNIRKRSPYLRKNFGKSSEIFGNWSEIFGKSSKTSSLVRLCNKQNITCPLVDMNFIFSCSSRHLTSSLRSLVRYRVEHSKIKFISTRGHVISSISFFSSREKSEHIFLGMFLRKQGYHVTNFARKTKVSSYKCWRWKNKKLSRLLVQCINEFKMN